VWETIDPDGRHVLLTRERWLHILERHQELEVDPDVILGAVADPDRRVAGPEMGEEWFYSSGFGPSRWLRVVVHCEKDRGRIVTVFPRRSFP